MALIYLDKLRGPFVQDNGVQIEGSGRIGTLNFLNANLDYDEATGVLSVDFDVTAALPDMASDRILGRDTDGTGSVESLTVGGGLEFTGLGGIQRSALTGDIVAAAGASGTTISNNVVSNAKLRDSTGLSVIGRSVNSSGDPADIVAANDSEVLKRSGTTLIFGTIVTANIGDGQVTFPKFQDIATDRLLGRDTAGTGDVEEIALGTGLEFTGTGSIQRSALTGDVTASAGSNSTTITNDAVTDAKLRNSAANSVIGRAAGTSGDPADIVATADGQVLARVGGVLQFVDQEASTVDDLPIANLEDIATDRILGRDTTGTGPVELLTVTNGLEFTTSGGIQRSALTGDVTASAGSNTTTIANNVVTDVKLRDSAAYTVIGRTSGTSGDPADIAAGTNTVLGRDGSNNLAFTQVQTGMVADAAITDAKLRNSAATSIIGRSAGTSGVPADITATSDDTYLARVGGVLQFVTIDTTIDDLPLANLEDIATDRILGRDTAGTGAVEQLTVTNGLEFTNSGGIQRSALTGDVTASAGSNATAIAANAVTDTKLRDSAGFSVIGRTSGTTGDPSDIAAGTNTVLGRDGSNNLTFGQVQSGMIATAAITDAKLRNSAATSVIGRSAGTTGVPADIAASADDQFLGRIGGVLQFASISAASIPAGSIPISKLEDIATDRILGRDSAGTGPVELLTATGGIEFTGTSGIQRSALTGDVTASAGSNATTIANNAVTDVKLRDSLANTVIGRAAGTTGDPADIAAGTDTVLGRNGSNNLAFTQVMTGMLAAQAVTFAKIQNIATDRLIGRDTASSGSPEEITVTGGLEFTGTAGIQRSALTGDVTASAGSNTTTIANNAVTDAKLRDSAALSVIGRGSNSTGDPADIAAGTDGHVLRRSGTTLAFGTIVTASIGDGQVTTAKLADLASDRLLGRDSAGTGPVESLTVGGGLEFTGSGGIQIANDGVTYAKIQNVSATGRILGRITTGAGDVEELTGAQVTSILAAAGSTGQIQYNNAGAFDGASGITVVGSETALAFGTAASAGHLRFAHNVAIMKGLQSGGGGDRTLMAWGTAANSLQIGAGGGATEAVADLYLDVISAGFVYVRTNGTNQFSVSSSSINCYDNNIFTTGNIRFGSAPATAGTIRMTSDTAICFNDNAGTSDILGLYKDATDAIRLGQQTGSFVAPTNMGFDVRTSGAFVFFVNAVAEYVIDATKISMGGNVLEFGTTSSTSGYVRFPFGNNFQLLAFRNGANSGDVKVLTIDSFGNDLAVGDHTSANGSKLNLYGVQVNIIPDNATTYLFDTGTANFGTNGLEFLYGGQIGFYRSGNGSLAGWIKAGVLHSGPGYFCASGDSHVFYVNGSPIVEVDTEVRINASLRMMGNDISSIEFLEIQGRAAPGNPAGVNDWRIYADSSNGRLRARNSAGTIRDLALP